MIWQHVKFISLFPHLLPSLSTHRQPRNFCRQKFMAGESSWAQVKEVWTVWYIRSGDCLR